MIFPICNKKPDRAPNIFGHTFILCWRCTGLVLGGIVGTFARLYFGNIKIYWYSLLIPVGIDGGLQYYCGVMSNNYRRFITGFIGGLITWIG